MAESHRLAAGGAKPRAKRKPELAGEPKATPPCTECGKRFSSWKALFGHMRCHPEREWRGINRPTSPPRASFTDEENQVAATLVLLANNPPPENPSGELDGAGGIRSLPSSFNGSTEREKAKRFSLDLNLPPPLENGDGRKSPVVVELKLGI